MSTNNQSTRFIKIFWIVFISPFVALFLIMILIEIGVFGFMPNFEDLENPKTNIASEIFSSDQQVLGKYFYENRTVVEFKEVSPNALNALIATEDIRFYEHSGIDFRALLRVLKGVITMNSEGGGSTITQQLAKNLFPRDTAGYSSKISKYSNFAIIKFKEWITAVKLERNYTKQEILAMYLNTVFFGSQAYGINSAAKTFFNARTDSLTIEQAATLVGMLKAPSAYNPKFNPINSLARRNTVLDQIQRYQDKLNTLHGFKKFSDAQFDSLRAIPIKLTYSVRGHNTGGSTYFREFLRVIMTKKEPEKPDATVKSAEYKRYLSDSIEWADNPLYGWCNKHKKPDGTNYDLYNDGLKIYTTVNSRMQQYAEEAVTEHMSKELQPLFNKRQKGNKKAPFSYMINEKQIEQIIQTSIRRSERYKRLKVQGKDSTEIQKIFNTRFRMEVFAWKGLKDTVMTPKDSILYYKFFLRAGFISMEPQTGYVRAYVGGINYEYFKFDHVSLSRRQVGSTIKPIIYSVAMENQMSPCQKVPNIPVTFEMPKGQYPATYTPKFSKSKLDGQMISLKMGLALSLNQISAWIMKKYGPLEVVRMAKRTGITSPLDTVFALCVGAAEVKLSEMVAAYDTYPNKGVHVDPVYVTRIEDKNGNIITTFKSKRNEVLSENTAYRMVDLMRGVVDMGTSTRLRYKYGLTNQIAGKTGTTNDNSDGWFIGYVPNLVSGAWVGGEERSIRFPSSAEGQGASLALPIWAIYMQKVYKDKSLGISKEPFEEPKSGDGIVNDCKEYEGENNNQFYITPEEDVY